MILKRRPRAILTDIEGTTGSISFVKRELFPYADARMDEYVRAHASDPKVRPYLDQAAQLASVPSMDVDAILHALRTWSVQDAKVQPLKAIQGAIWRGGFQDGTLQGHVYDDAVNALRSFHAAGIRLYVYSSGSVEAQKLLFAHTAFGDLTLLFDGFFDISVGKKREQRSYQRIADEIGLPPGEVLFISDVAEELAAAAQTGMQTVQMVREEDGTQPDARFACVASFDELGLPN